MTISGSVIGAEFDDAFFSHTTIHAGNRLGFEACKKVAMGRSLGVVLFGMVGTGKTHHLVCTAREFEEQAWGGVALSASAVGGELVKADLHQMIEEYRHVDLPDDPPILTKDEIENPVDVRFWYVPELMAMLREEIGEGLRWTANKCRECDLLLLDDFGTERATDFVLEKLDEIIDYRYRNQLPIAVSTNLKWSLEIRAKYGDRAVSRWSEHCEVVEMTGRDMRLGGA